MLIPRSKIILGARKMATISWLGSDCSWESFILTFSYLISTTISFWSSTFRYLLPSHLLLVSTNPFSHSGHPIFQILRVSKLFSFKNYRMVLFFSLVMFLLWTSHILSLCALSFSKNCFTSQISDSAKKKGGNDGCVIDFFVRPHRCNSTTML